MIYLGSNCNFIYHDQQQQFSTSRKNRIPLNEEKAKNMLQGKQTDNNPQKSTWGVSESSVERNKNELNRN
jgi:hypothetical protein